jgi:hypothetical protein
MENGSRDRIDSCVESARGCLPPFGDVVADRPRGPDDLLFWQFPARTEAAAQANHAGERAVALHGDTLHVYVGLPWATFLEKKRGDARLQNPHGLRAFATRSAASARCASHGLPARPLRALAPMWQSLGVTDAWLPPAGAGIPNAALLPFALHPWRLLRSTSKTPNAAPELTSAAIRPPSDTSLVRRRAPRVLPVGRAAAAAALRRRALPDPDQRTSGTLQDVVFGHQVGNAPLAESYRIDETVTEYNRVLSESVFALCPPGAGPNSLRLWESMAVGAIPVLFEPEPALPRGGSLPEID